MEYYDPYSEFGSGARPTGTASVPTASPTPSPASSIQTSAGYTPDYAALLQNDPAYTAARNAAGQSQADAASRRRAAIRQAYVRYGGNLPAGFQDTYGDLDQATLDAAKGNQQSVLANLGYNYAQSVEQFHRSLAARGGLQSSELDYGGDQLSRGYAQQQYDAGNQFLDEANNDIGQYTGVLNTNAQNLASSIASAEGNVYGNPAYRPTEASYASYDSASSARYGQPVYSGGDGQLYDSNGNPFAPAGTPDDWAHQTGTDSGYSPGVGAGNIASLYGG